MSNITFSKATTADIPVLIENRILFAIELGGNQTEKEVEELKKSLNDYLTRTIANNTCISFLAKIEDEVVGVGTLQIREQPGNFKNLSGKSGYIMNMYTNPKHRRKGICNSILNELINEASKMGIIAFELHATKTGEFVYLQNGFKVHTEPTLRKYLSEL